MPKIAVVGAGIGGLTAALLLQKAGFPVEVYEQAPELGEVGAGLTLSKGSQTTLREAGVLDAVKTRSMLSTRVPFLHYATGALLAGAYDQADGLEDIPDIVGRQIHRADLHGVLADAFIGRGGVIRLGHRLEGFEAKDDSVRLEFAQGQFDANLLIGADGLHSNVRKDLFGDTPPIFTHQVAWRFLAPWADAAPFMGVGRAAVYFGPSRVINRYTLRKGEIVNCVALARTETFTAEGWSVAGDPAEMMALFEGWHADVRGLLAQATPASLKRWGLFHRDPLPMWSRGPVTLLGDSAHPMLPFLGLGAAMAIEDAMVLARALTTQPTIGEALALYETIRKPRTAEVYRQSVRQGELLQSRDPDNYDGAAAPAADPAFYDYDPVTAPLRP